EVVEKFYMMDNVNKWSTTWLVVHSSKDYRLPQTGGIGAFHVLKQCAHLPMPWHRKVIFPDEGHRVQVSRQLKHVMITCLCFSSK
ncbi:hypothetical protein BJV78DRAFT_1131872, partial [Lactifluus subvellereus]